MFSQLARITIATIFVGSAALAGCSGGSSNGPATTATAEVKAGVPDGHLPMVDLALKLDGLKLRPEQRTTLEAMQTDLQAKTGEVRKEGKALALLLASSLDAGKFDSTAVEGQIAKVKTALDAQKPVHQAAMAKLHDTLDKDQRQALVDGMHGKLKGGHEGKGFGMKKFMGDLNLTADQKDALHAAMKQQHKSNPDKGAQHEWSSGKDQMKQMADAFVSDQFDAQNTHVGMHAGGFAVRAAKFVEVAIPILDADQRAALAKTIRAHADKI
jgi:Spy/CpxP family protein refolding chaperone